MLGFAYVNELLNMFHGRFKIGYVFFILGIFRIQIPLLPFILFENLFGIRLELPYLLSLRASYHTYVEALTHAISCNVLDLFIIYGFETWKTIYENITTLRLLCSRVSCYEKST